MSKVDGRRRQPANAARPPRADRFLQSAMTWVETPPPRAAIGLLRSRGPYPPKGCTEGVLYSHRSRLRGGRLLPVSGIFWGGLEGAGTSKPSPPDAVRPTPPLPPTCVCCRWGGGCGQRPSARDAPAPHMLCWVLEVHVWVTDRLSRSGRDRTPPRRGVRQHES